MRDVSLLRLGNSLLACNTMHFLRGLCVPGIDRVKSSVHLLLVSIVKIKCYAYIVIEVIISEI